MNKMKQKVDVLLEKLSNQPESIGRKLRLDLSLLLLSNMEKNKFTIKKLAKIAGIEEPIVKGIVQGDVNCTFDVAGRLLFALGVREYDVKLHHSFEYCMK